MRTRQGGTPGVRRTTVVLALLASPVALGATQSLTYSPSTPRTVDGVTDTLVTTFAMNSLTATSVVDDVEIDIRFRKTDGSCTAPGSGTPFHNETGFALFSPNGTRVDVINSGQWPASGSNPLVTMRFADAHSAAMPTTLPATGDWKPDELLSGFDNGGARGNWLFRATDTAGADPLCIHSVTLRVTSREPVVAQAGGPYSANEGSGPTLTSAGSTSGATYEWDCTSDGTYDVTGATTSACVYPNQGTYTARLRVSQGGFSITDTATVNVSNVAPTVTGMTVPSSVPEGSSSGLAVAASDPGADVLAYLWDFGDGSSSSSAAPNKAWAQDGDYTVAVVVTDGDGGTDVDTRNVTVTNVAPSIVVLDVPATVDEGSAAALAVSASDPGADVLTYSWDFGDGTNATDSSTSKTWADNGSYTVQIAVQDDDTTTSASQLIEVLNVAPSIDNWTTPNGTEGAAVAMTASASDPGADSLSYAWDFGDGSTSTEQNPTHTWASDGSYTVTLTVTDDDGGVVADSRVVDIANTLPVIDSVLLTDGVEGQALAFSASASDAGNDALTYTWMLPDGSQDSGSSISWTPPDDGSYDITLVVEDTEGGSVEQTGTITVSNADPVVAEVIAPAGDEGQPVALSVSATDVPADTLSYAWDFGDGNTAVGDSPAHTWVQDGTYTVTVAIADEDGGSAVEVRTVTIANLAPTIVSVAAPQTLEGVATNLTVAATDPGNDPITYSWDFGDGSTGTGANPSHTWADNGTYTVAVTATDNAGDSDTSTVSVIVDNVSPEFTGLVSLGLEEGETYSPNIDAQDVSADTLSFLWDFGDGTTSTDAVPSHAWADDGTYTVTLTVSDEDGGSLTRSVEIFVSNVDPTIDLFVANGGDEGEELVFESAASDPGDDTLSYLWDFGDGGTSSDASPVHTYADNGVYVVQLTVSDEDGGSTSQFISIEILNTAPVLDLVTIVDPVEGVAQAVSAVASDAGADELTYSWDFGDGGSATGADASYTWLVPGSYTVTVVVTDDDGDSDTYQQDITVLNADPVIGVVSVPAGQEGLPSLFTAEATDPGPDPLTYTWDVEGFPTPFVGSEVSVTPADDGSYAVTLTVTDEDGGSTEQLFAFAVGNIAPAVLAFDDVSGDEASEVLFEAVAFDVPDDTISYSWDFGDGETMVTTEPSATHTFADNLDYEVTLTVSDEDGGSSEAVATASIANVAPTIDGVVLAEFADEGSEVLFEVEGSDVSAVDVLAASWDLGDGTMVDGFDGAHSWMDEGEYTVVVTVSDDDGGESSESYTIAVANVAPEFVNAPGETGEETVPYEFTAEVEEPGDDVLTFTLEEGPPGASVDPETGEIDWTPSFDDASMGVVQFKLKVDDGDGGEDELEWEVDVSYLDSDGDDLPDTWENENGFDPNDPSDGLGDPDADGRPNGWEFENGSDPNTYEGPSEPTLIAPIDGAEVNDEWPILLWANAERVFDDPIVYELEVYEDETMANLIAYFPSVPEKELETPQMVQDPIAENSQPYWRVRAVDPYVAGPWTEPADFFYNALEEAPPVPDTLFPLDSLYAAVDGDLQASTVIDPDRDEVVYDFELADADENVLIGSADLVAELEAADVWWASAWTFEEDLAYLWRVRARDEHGDASDWSDWAWFRYSDEAHPPSEVAWIRPTVDERVESLSPELVLSSVEDPEGYDLDWRIVLSLDPAFATEDVVIETSTTSAAGLEEVFVAESEVREHEVYYGRAEVFDADGFATPVATTEFFVHGPNDAPSIPELTGHNGGDVIPVGGGFPAFAFDHSTDAEGDEIVYHAQILDIDGAVVVEDLAIPHVGEVAHEWVPEAEPWTAGFGVRVRAVDALGASSDWSTAYSVDLTLEEDLNEGGCGCSTGGVGGMWLALLPLVALRRKR